MIFIYRSLDNSLTKIMKIRANIRIIKNIFITLGIILNRKFL